MAQLGLSLSCPWAIRRGSLAAITKMQSHAFGFDGDDDFQGHHPHQEINAKDGTAIIPVRGILEQRPGLWGWLSGGSSYEEITAHFLSAMGDESVSRIILDFDSPGGSILGVAELAELIFQSRDRKPIIAIANNLCASAAYWLASACSEIVLASATSMVGSIGVVSIHADLSTAEERAGIKITEVVAGKFKRAASAHAPLDDEGLSVLQEQVDQIYGIFLESIGKYLGLSAAIVHEKMGDGRDFIGQRAVDAGLARRIESFTKLLSNRSGAGFIRKENMPMGMTTRAEEKENPAKKSEEVAGDALKKEEDEEERKKKEAEMMDEEKHKDETMPAAAISRERARISAILNLSGISLDSLAQEAIAKGISKEGYALRVLESRPKKLAAMERESRSVPPWEAVGEESKIVANACKAVNDAKRR